MIQSKTIYGIEERMTKEGLPEARGGVIELNTDNVPAILESWDFESVIITMPGRFMAFFPTEFAVRKYIKDAVESFGPSYLRNFKLGKE